MILFLKGAIALAILYDRSLDMFPYHILVYHLIFVTILESACNLLARPFFLFAKKLATLDFFSILWLSLKIILARLKFFQYLRYPSIDWDRPCECRKSKTVSYVCSYVSNCLAGAGTNRELIVCTGKKFTEGSMTKVVEVLEDKNKLIERSLSLTIEKIEAAIAARGQFTIALSGGSTPKPLYQAISEKNLPWDKIHVFWGDERYVAPDDEQSNQKMARDAWLDRVKIPPENIHPMPTGAKDPVKDAKTHEAELKDFFGLKNGEFPVFDLILLGMGDDGHTASLFPHTEALKVDDCLVTVGNKNGEPRITFTVPLINNARCVMFVVAGENKQAALEQIFAPDGDAMSYPSRLIEPKGELWWLLDRAAGEKINK